LGLWIAECGIKKGGSIGEGGAEGGIGNSEGGIKRGYELYLKWLFDLFLLK